MGTLTETPHTTETAMETGDTNHYGRYCPECVQKVYVHNGIVQRHGYTDLPTGKEFVCAGTGREVTVPEGTPQSD